MYVAWENEFAERFEALVTEAVSESFRAYWEDDGGPIVIVEPVDGAFKVRVVAMDRSGHMEEKIHEEQHDLLADLHHHADPYAEEGYLHENHAEDVRERVAQVRKFVESVTQMLDSVEASIPKRVA